MKTVKVFGTDWCGDTKRTLAQLKQLGVPFEYTNIEQDPAAAAWVREQNAGKEKKPTVDVSGIILSVPSEGELDAALQAAKAAD